MNTIKNEELAQKIIKRYDKLVLERTNFEEFFRDVRNYIRPTKQAVDNAEKVGVEEVVDELPEESPEVESDEDIPSEGDEVPDPSGDEFGGDEFFLGDGSGDGEPSGEGGSIPEP